MPSEPILVYYTENDLHKLKIKYVSEDAVTETLNGESGYHIFHVRMIKKVSVFGEKMILEAKTDDINSKIVEYAETFSSGVLKTSNAIFKNEYGWFSKISILEDLPEQYSLYPNKKEKKATLFDKIKQWNAVHSLLIKIIELVLLFLLSEFFIHLQILLLFFNCGFPYHFHLLSL